MEMVVVIVAISVIDPYIVISRTIDDTTPRCFVSWDGY